MVFIDPIYDRTEQDVERVVELNAKFQNRTITPEEIAEWRLNLKGALNRSDLERIINNVNFLANELGVSVVSQTIPEIPREQFYETLLDNVQAIRDAWMTYLDTPQLPALPLNTYYKWNIIEKVLFDIEEILSNALWYHAGIDLMADDNIII